MKKGTDLAVTIHDFYIVHQNIPSKKTTRRSFAEHVLFIPLSGEIKLQLNDSVLALGSGQMAFLPAHTLHAFSSADYAGERIIVMFKGPVKNNNGPQKLPLSQLLKEIIFYLLTHPKASSGKSLCRVFIQTLGEFLAANGNPENPYHVIGKVKDVRLKNALAILENNFTEVIKTQDLAKRAGLSSRNFTRLLNQETGTSPKQLVMSLRVEEAKRLLQNGATVLEASQAVGYESLSQFIAAFRSRTGQLPSRFAK